MVKGNGPYLTANGMVNTPEDSLKVVFNVWQEAPTCAMSMKADSYHNPTKRDGSKSLRTWSERYVERSGQALATETRRQRLSNSIGGFGSEGQF